MTTEEAPDRLTEADVARYWDEIADHWASDVGRGYDVYREHLNNPAFFRLVGDLSGKVVLDAGCGEGYNTRLLARAGAQVTGVDISPKMLAHARRAEAAEPLGIRYVETSFADLSPFAEATFDAVLSFMALMDGPDYEEALQEFHRVLRPGGLFAFSILHPCFVTRDSRWLRDETGNETALAISHYFDPTPLVERWRFSHAPQPYFTPLFAIPYFPRTLTDYVNGLLRAGFVLQEVAEPRPTDAVCRQFPRWRRWQEHAALFLHLKATKVASG